MALLAVLFGIGAATLLPLHLTESWLGRPLPTTTPALLGYLYVGIFPAVIAFFGWNRGVAAIGPRAGAGVSAPAVRIGASAAGAPPASTVPPVACGT